MKRIFGAAAVVLACQPLLAAAQDEISDVLWRFRMITGVDYSNGDYGAEENTEIVYMPLTLQGELGPWMVRGTIPWVHKAGPALVSEGGGGEAGATVPGRAGGIGDISMALRYSIAPMLDNRLLVDFTGRVKVPTASAAEGLGTGEEDYRFEIDLAYVFGVSHMPFATVGYKFPGDPPGSNRRNAYYFSLGYQYVWDERISSGVYYDYSRATIRTATDPQDLTAFLNFRFAQRWSANVYVVKGLSRSSPNLGSGLLLTYRWE